MYEYQIINGKRIGKITTKHGVINLPTFMPVTTFGDKYPLDKMVQPYLKRMSDCLMVSHYYAQKMKERPNMPIFIDSGGFAGLFEGSEIIEYDEYASIKTREGDEINPLDVLHFQIKNADIGATLDFIIPPGTNEKECIRRQDLTIKNALYAQKHNIVGDLILYASLQCWDEDSARRCAKIYADSGFKGIAIGGMVPHAQDPEYIKRIVHSIRTEAPECAIHVFGCGNLELIPSLVNLGADSFDSSSYIRSAVKSSQYTSKFGDIYVAINSLQATQRIVSNKSISPISKMLSEIENIVL